MAIGPHVFGDDRLGCWVVNLPKLAERLPKFKVTLGITDLFLPRTATKDQLKQVRDTGLGAHMWAAVDDLSADAYANRWLDDIAQKGPGAADFNIELSNDPALEPYMRRVLQVVRSVRKSFRIRLNVAPRKHPFLPVDLLQQDEQLYVTEQNYFGNMASLYSDADIMLGMADMGVPLRKASVCYAAACTVGGVTGTQRVNTIPLGWALRRGVIFHDDLLQEAGLL